VFQKKMHKV